MIHLISISRQDSPLTGAFPFTVPVITALDTLTFTTPVTFLVGENGSGKSTLLEAIAAGAGSITVGAAGADQDDTLAAVRALGKALRLTWSKRTRKGFFMRSEDFFGFVKRVGKMRDDLRRDLESVDSDYEGRSELARNLAKLPYTRELHSLDAHYGPDLDAHSHGESYFTLFKSRFVPGGLYLLDEPEAPLSPMRQLSFLAMLKMMVDQDAQFIIATHSPILMAYPGATILSFDAGAITPVDYDSLEHVSITRSFLNDPDQYLRHLMA